MPKIAPRPVRDFIGRPPTSEGLAINADVLLDGLERFGWPQDWPERPEELVYSDFELWTSYRKQERGERLSAKDTEQLQLFGHWKSAVCLVESAACGRLQTCLGVLRTLELLERGEDASRLRVHIFQQFRCSVPVPAPERHHAWTRCFAEHFSKNWKLLPLHSRRMTKPPDEYAWARDRKAKQAAGEEG